MIRRYQLPIMGKVLKKDPLTGDKDEPLEVFPIEELEGRPTQTITVLDEGTHLEVNKVVPEDFHLVCLDYNIDEEWCEVELEASEIFHGWLTDLLPQLKNIQMTKGWKLDKTKMKESPKPPAEG